MDNDKQNWGEAYMELADLIVTKVPEIKHVDLYYGQEAFMDEDGNWIPFKAPAVFLEFNAADMRDSGVLAQDLLMDIRVLLWYETVQDTNRGSAGQTRALGFIDLMRKLHGALHNASGDHFSPLSRVAMGREDGPPIGYFYSQTYRGVIVDYGATLTYTEEDTPPLDIQGDPPDPEGDDEPLFPSIP